MNEKKPDLMGTIIVSLVILVVAFFVVAFVHDLITGQLHLPGSSDPCSQYTTPEAQDFCADNLP
jgi:hypothetical protein